MPAKITIDDHNYMQFIDHTGPDGQLRKRGLIPRNFSTHPKGCFAAEKPFDIPLIPDDQWPDLLSDQQARNADLETIRNHGMFGQPIPSRDQNGKGYCWAHSSTSAALLVRASQGLPYVDLSAFMVACIIKGYRDEGGYGAESLDFIAANGIPSSQFWPQQSMSRSNDNPAMRANAAEHKYQEWMGLGNGPGTMKQQLVTCLLQPIPIPVVVDFDWWQHSVCAIKLISLNPFTIDIWNSWGDSWSNNGVGALTGSKAIPDDAIAPRLMTASQT